MDISKTDSEIIKICRVVCIFFMMSVHFYPYSGNTSILTSGHLSIIGTVWTEYLGRASVATLSMISGYLLCRGLTEKNLSCMLSQRSQVLLIPMAVWNFIFICAALSLTFLGVKSDAVPLFDSWIDTINALTGLFGPTVNYSLFFIRDLYVCSLLLAIFWPVFRRFPLVTLLIVIPFSLGDLLEPVIFRPMILVFMIAGCILCEKKISLQKIAAPSVSVSIMVFSGVLSLFLVFLSGNTFSGLTLELLNASKRTGLIAGVMLFAYTCVNINLSRYIIRYEPFAYLAYLSHVLTAKFLWEVFSLAGVKVTDTGYILYFFIVPFFVFKMAEIMMSVIHRFPVPLPRLLTGKPRPGVKVGRVTKETIRNSKI